MSLDARIETTSCMKRDGLDTTANKHRRLLDYRWMILNKKG
jgi:hypothetical protein